MIDQTELRARFARALSAMYGTEVPAYNTLVEVSTEVNRDVLAADPATAERLGSIDRVTAERHGAIRLGTPDEMRKVAQVFAGIGPFGTVNASQPLPYIARLSGPILTEFPRGPCTGWYGWPW